MLTAEFTRLAVQMGASAGVLDPRDPVASVHAVLAKSNEPWLLVFDNVLDQEQVRRFLPPAGNGQVLITSQSALWPAGQAVEVPVLDTQVAARFLNTRTGDPDVQAAAGLAAEMGGLPLALEQAAAYVQATGGSLARYLDGFRERRAELLSRGEPVGYEKTVATTWALAFGRVEHDAPQAAGLLQLLACLAPAPVPLSLLLPSQEPLEGDVGPDVLPVLGAVVTDWLAVQDAIAELRRYSLVTLAGDGLVLAHRLVQAVTVSQMVAGLAAQWQQVAAALITAAIPADTGAPESWPVCAVLQPHAQAVLADDSEGTARIADYLGASGSYVAARDVWRKNASARNELLGAEHPATLTARHNVAYWTGEAGGQAAARDLFTVLFPVRKRVSGANHPDTLATGGNVARWTGLAGDPVAARDLFAALLPAFERVLGPEHPDTLTTRHEIATWTGRAGDPAAARDLFAALLPDAERILGSEHPDTLDVRGSFASFTGQAGDPAAARDLFAALLPDRERVLGPEHPDTLSARHNLASFTGRTGNPAAARDLFAALLPDRERVLGPEHPDTLTTRARLAFVTGEAGDPSAARDQYANLLPAFEQVLGPEHPDTLMARHNLAFWTGNAENPAAARDLFAALLPDRERVLGADDLATLTTRGELAYYTGHAGDPISARDQCSALLADCDRALGSEHSRTRNARAGLAYWTIRALTVSPTKPRSKRRGRRR
jgi:Tetratricopeptide repeat